MGNNIEKFLKYIEERFGITKESFEGFSLLDYGDIWLSSREVAEFKIKSFKRKGIRVARLFKDGKIKVATSFMQLFGKEAKKNVVQLTREEAVKFIEGLDIELADVPEGVSDGQVIVKFHEYPLGSALLRGKRLKNQLPRGKRIKIKI